MSDASNGLSHGSTINGVTLEASGISKATGTITGIPITIDGGILTETFPPYSITAIVLRSGN